ncbi:MAG TPA: phage holin family protein [Burkholderiales bacterium]|nr:phage holin family protein [Burkholderiales bacterium]
MAAQPQVGGAMGDGAGGALGADSRRPGGLGDLLGHMLGEARHLVGDYAELAVLDARRAALTLAWLLGMVLVVAVLLVTAWMGICAAFIVWMFAEGVSWPLAIAIAALVNIAAAAALGWYMKSLVKELPFKALLRQLRGEDPPPAPRGEGYA